MADSTISYVINLNQADAWIVALVVGLALLAWAWGALLKSALGLNRWFGLLMLVPIINLLAFMASGVAAHHRLLDHQNKVAYEKIKRLMEEDEAADMVPAKAD
ncbi:MAG: hypothetical protein Q8L35_00305 [Actinomycetota bacterium]|nr:hypothetical protein [Actinomycetota bacterium]